jgi:hypothetical protein
VTPVATSLKDTETDLQEEVAGSDRGPRSFVTAYYVQDRAAADLLIDWFQRQKGVASARLDEGLTRTHARGVGVTNAGTVYFGEETWWELTVQSSPKELGPSDVTAWIQLLKRVPADARWRLGPSLVAKPSRIK